MLHRVKKQNDINHDKWIGVGGKVELGETHEQCVVREVLEETGLVLTDYSYRGVVSFESDIYENEYMHLYTADGFTGELIECDEGTLEWVEADRVIDLPTWEGDRIFLRLLFSDAPFFELTLRYEGERLVYVELNGEQVTDI